MMNQNGLENGTTIYKIREQAIKRIRILENLVGTGSSPWMILTILPVIPPALRP
jgi:DNA-directed RNA polymerase beta' subunit